MMSEQDHEEFYPYHVAFTEATVAALKKAAMLGGDNETDTVNRAVQIYAALVEETVLHGKKIAIHGGKPVPVRLVFERGMPRLMIESEVLDIGK
jgi:hypothetical protein